MKIIVPGPGNRRHEMPGFSCLHISKNQILDKVPRFTKETCEPVKVPIKVALIIFPVANRVLRVTIQKFIFKTRKVRV